MMSPMKLATMLLAGAVAALPAAAQTPQFGQLFNFKGGAGGSTPGGALVQYAGKLYGTTVAGGGSTACATGCGTVYSLAPPASPGSGWTATTIYAFSGGADGGYPAAGLTLGSGGVLYGAAQNGGTSNRGTVFALSQTGPGGTWQETVLHSFAGGDDGSYPTGTLALGTHGELYGTTTEGDADGAGTVFSLTPPTAPGGHWTIQGIWAFAGGADGTNPTKGLTLDPATGVIYGTTRYGGGKTFGTVFSLTPPAAPGGFWTKATLHSFMNANDGAYPNELLLGSAGVLYGTTAGYSDQGTAYALEPPASPGGHWALKVLHDFAGNFTDGVLPEAGMVKGSGGVLYGTTARGGTDENCSCGTAFALTPPAAAGGEWTYQLLFSFVSTQGVAPQAPLLYGDSGILYGTTAYGGSHGAGTVFALQVK